MQPSEESEMSEESLQQLGKFVVDSDIIKDGARSLFQKALGKSDNIDSIEEDDAAADLYNLVKEDKLRCLREDAEVKVSCI